MINVMKIIFLLLSILTCASFTYCQLPEPVYSYMFNPVTRYTPKGASFSAGKLLSNYELTQPEKNSAAAYILQYYNNRITILSEATRSYNCHGYAWYVIEGGDNVWINTPNDDEFWEDGSYVQISRVENAKIAFSETADHSAIATNHQDTLISKWGQFPLVKHHINDCEYTPKTNLKYYKLSKPVISGNFNTICNGSQRIFHESAFTHINLDYDWSSSSYYLNEISGPGNSDYTVEGTSNIGYSIISLNITTPSGVTSSTHNYVGVNMPYPGNLSFSLFNTNGTPVSYMCPETHYHIYLNNDDDCSLSNYNWIIPSAWTENYTWSNMISVYTGSTPGGMVEVYANTCCGMNTKVFTDYLSGGYCRSSYSMRLSPNPTTGETTLSIETTSDDTEFNENVEWELEVYSPAQLLKEKKTNLRGKNAKIQTSGWTEGIYIVRVKYKDEVLQGKLVVKNYFY